MLSDTLESFRPVPRRARLAARVAQFRSVTGSSDNINSSGAPDLEVGPLDVDPQALGAGAAASSATTQHQQHQQQHGHEREHGLPAPEPPAGDSRVTHFVEQQVRVHRLEAMWGAESVSGGYAAAAAAAAARAGSSGREQQHHHQPRQQEHQQQQQQEQQQRDYSHPADDELLPLLAEVAAAHPAAAPAAAAAAAAPKQQQQQQQQQQPAMMRGGVPRSIFVLSMVSMALTSASCVFNTLLPIYMVTELKMTMKAMGMFEGMLEAFSYVVRMFSGVISDRMASRKAAIGAGFAMGAAAKFGMSFAGSTVQLFLTKAVDRLGNGVQAAPRDALIGDLSPSASRSACFGFAQSMRKWGSFMGAGLAFALMKASGNNYQAIFLLAAGVSALSTVAFVLLVPSHPNTSGTAAAAAAAKQQPQQQQQQQQQRGRRQGQSWAGTAAAVWRDVRCMGVDFWRTLGVIALYGLGHINESLLEARAIEVGFGKAESTLVVALLCFSVFLCAYPLGRLDDRFGHATTFALGMAALVAGDLVLLCSGAWPAAVFVACGFWGAHWAVVQGPMLSAVVGMAPPHLKGTAFGIFYTVMALVAMAANTMFGTVWHARGATAAFALSAIVIAFALVVMPFLLPESAKVGRHAAPAGAGDSGGAGAGGLAPAPA